MSTYERVEKVLDKIRPYIQSDGGDISLVSVDDASGVVKVTLHGACAAAARARRRRSRAASSG
jgi:Fe-S cluster biogenesis protein NfuA